TRGGREAPPAPRSRQRRWRRAPRVLRCLRVRSSESVQTFAKLLHAELHPCLDGTERLAGALRDFGLRQALAIRELQRRALRRRQLAESGTYGGAFLGRDRVI